MIILAHPRPGSFNHAIAEECRKTMKSAGHNVLFHDLYIENFDPVSTAGELEAGYKPEGLVKKHIDNLVSSDGLIFVHPNWWGQPPAILKGWVDRVIIPGVAYTSPDPEIGDNIPVGLLKGKKALVYNTGDTPMDREMNFFGDPLEKLWLTCTFDFCGLTDCQRRLINVITDSTVEQRKQWLSEVSDQTAKFFS